MYDPMQRAPAGRGRGSQDQRAAEHHEDTSPSLFDEGAEEGRRRRDEGVRVAAAAAHTGWKLYAERLLSELIAEGGEFTSDDLRARTGEPLGTNPSVFGALIQGAVKRGEIVQVGWATSTRPQAHARPVRVWTAKGGGSS